MSPGSRGPGSTQRRTSEESRHTSWPRAGRASDSRETRARRDERISLPRRARGPGGACRRSQTVSRIKTPADGSGSWGGGPRNRSERETMLSMSSEIRECSPTPISPHKPESPNRIRDDQPIPDPALLAGGRPRTTGCQAPPRDPRRVLQRPGGDGRRGSQPDPGAHESRGKIQAGDHWPSRGRLFTINPVVGHKLSVASNRLRILDRAATDADIPRRRRIFIHFDPWRNGEPISSTEPVTATQSSGHTTSGTT